MANVGEILQRVFRDTRKGLVSIDNPTDAIERGNGWVAHYEFSLTSGTTVYLVFETSDKYIHVRNRSVNVVDLDNQIINVQTKTLTNATIDTLGNDISDKVINANFNLDNSIQIDMYDETTTLTDEGAKLPFSGTLRADRRQAALSFIQDEYILKRNNYLAIKFENLGDGDVRVEYTSNGYQHD